MNLYVCRGPRSPLLNKNVNTNGRIRDEDTIFVTNAPNAVALRMASRRDRVPRDIKPPHEYAIVDGQQDDPVEDVSRPIRTDHGHPRSELGALTCHAVPVSHETKRNTDRR